MNYACPDCVNIVFISCNLLSLLCNYYDLGDNMLKVVHKEHCGKTHVPNFAYV